MKKLLLIFLAFLLFACSKEEVKYQNQLVDNSTACIDNLKEDKLIQACLDLEELGQNYIVSDKNVDYSLFESIVNDLLKISDVSTNTAIVEKTNTIIDNLKVISNFEENSLITYKDNIDKEKYKKLINGFKDKTSLKLEKIKKEKVNFENEDYAVDVIFEDDNNIQIEYNINSDNKLEKITMKSLKDQKRVYLNYAKLYSKFILLNNLNESNRNSDYDSFLVEKKLQFNNSENFRSNYDIEVKEDVVTFQNLDLVIE